ncbi:Gfo/Idh/MocA family protein [Nocardiopsis sp. MG754419]|uniref:Gfo/Idh/MocA family protein n=1 Tax=Nocardiopsis sp. MG754419 TaxID=2259865 RepID=UPI001BAC52A5|nr:Gfo/Idh/MocA family oxidoreductase [Nocardiopsis sp. MG754419]MBR8740962.1 gfo/Idh/MocA family oxidoreductase [Nocardiopsis sp. MG754419]
MKKVTSLGDPSSGPATPRAYRAAVVGTGFMGRVHSHAVRANGGEVVGVAGSSHTKAERFGAAHGIARAHADALELIHSPDVDVVHVCTPNHLHAPLSLAALAAGKHVVCEKPLATDAATARELTRAAAEADRVAVVPFVYRFHPMAREARARVAAGAIGRVSLAHGGYLQDWLLYPEESNWRVDPDIGGPTRAFGDIGSHWCDMLEFVTGDRITAVSAQTSRISDTRGENGGSAVTTEDLVSFQFDTAGGTVGTAVISQVSPGRKNHLTLEVSGTKGSLRFDQERPETLWAGGRARTGVISRDDPDLSPDAARLVNVPVGHPQGYQDCFNALVADTGAAIAGETPEGLPVFADGLRTAVLAEAVLTSARERRWVDVPSVDGVDPA